MRKVLSFSMTAVLLSAALAVAHAQCAQVTPSGDTVTVTANTWRSLNAIAQTLANTFGIVISAEDPDLLFTGDLTDTTERALPAWRTAHPNTRVYIPKTWRLQFESRTHKGDTPEDRRGAVAASRKRSKCPVAIRYGLDVDGEFNTFVPTRTRDEAGGVVEKVRLLDRHIDIPAGTRMIAQHGEMLAKALSTQTGLRVSCCQLSGAGIPWGMARVEFEAHDEPARKVLERIGFRSPCSMRKRLLTTTMLELANIIRPYWEQAVFEHYTEKARRVIFFARYEASQFGSTYIESEHLLLGLLRESKALSARLFASSPTAVDKIRKQVETHRTFGEKTPTSVDLPVSEECKRILLYASEEADALAHKHIGTEHLLLGMLREQDCYAAQLLNENGVDLEGARAHVAGEPREVPRDGAYERLIALARDARHNDVRVNPVSDLEWKFAFAVLKLNRHPMSWLLG